MLSALGQLLRTWSSVCLSAQSLQALDTPSLPPYFLDMGNGQPDDSIQVDAGQQPALNTTRLVLNQINETDLVLHIGDISYARGFAGVVRSPQLCSCLISKLHAFRILLSVSSSAVGGLLRPDSACCCKSTVHGLQWKSWERLARFWVHFLVTLLSENILTLFLSPDSPVHKHR